jgi:cyclic-di-GMP phosphodiesterase TipF (flagellum assembly factor)
MSRAISSQAMSRARRAGRLLPGIWIGLACLASAALAVLAVTGDLFGRIAALMSPAMLVGAGIAIVGFALAAFALSRIGAARAEARKAASDLDIAMARLTALDSRMSGLQRALEQRVAPHAAPSQRDNTIAELTAEIGLLGGLMKDLADTVSQHDRSLERLDRDLRATHGAVQATQGAIQAALQARTTSSAPAASVAQGAGQPAQRPATAPRQAAPQPAAPQPAPSSAQTAAKPAIRQPAAQPVAPAAEPLSPPPPPASAPQSAPGGIDDALAQLAVGRRDRESDIASRERQEAIVAALVDDRVEVHLQPIVRLPQRKSFIYDILGRLRLSSGEVLAPSEFVGVLARQGLAASFDERMLARTFQIARHLAARDPNILVACHLSAAALGAPGSLAALRELVARNSELAQRLVVTIAQGTWRSLDIETIQALRDLTQSGIRYCIEAVTDSRLDPAALAARGVRFLKLSARALLNPGVMGFDIERTDLAALFARAGITLIVEEVEDEAQVRELLDYDVVLAQGLVFAVPRPVRPDILAPEPAAAPAPAPAPEKKPERLPFRSFLRRA